MNDDYDIVMMKQKGKDTIKESEKHMDRVETQWDIQSENWGKGLISGIDMDRIIDEFQKQSAELENKLGVWQKWLEDLDTAAVKKEESFSDGQELVKSEVELHLVEVKHLNIEACEHWGQTDVKQCKPV